MRNDGFNQGKAYTEYGKAVSMLLRFRDHLSRK